MEEVTSRKDIIFSWLAPILLSLFIFISSLIVATSYYKVADQNNLQHFADIVVQAEESILKRYSVYEQTLLGGVGLFEASDSVGHESWERYVDALSVDKTLPGINGLGFIEHVMADELDSFLEGVQNDGNAQFKNHPKTLFNDKFIVKYLVPENENQQAIGLDIGFESNRRAAAERARDTGEPSITEKIVLVQDSEKSNGFLLLIPFYKKYSHNSLPSERRKNIIGWVYAPFISKNFFYGLDYLQEDKLSFEVYDGQAVLPENKIYKNFDEEVEGHYTLQRSVNIADHNWTIVWKSTDQFVSLSHSRLFYIISLIGLLLSILSYFFSKLLFNLKREAEEKAKGYKEQQGVAEEAGKAKEDFLANMSHELRTPLNSIIGLTKILIDEGKFEKEEEESLNIIESASNTLLRTVNDILDISKIEAGHMTLEKNSFDLSNVMHSLVDQIRPLASQKGLDISDNLEDLKETYVAADEYRISRIITNLLSNAVQYTNEGQIKIKFQVGDCGDQETDFTVVVSDTGIGIPEDKQDSIFDKFCQADKSTERQYGGTGLGLSITKKLVDLMMGVISVESEVGVGTTFTVRLPLVKSDESEVRNKESFNDGLDYAADQKLHISAAKILVAEDHEFNKIFIQKILKRIGNDNYILVSNGVKALAAFKKSDFDVVLMDHHMPKMSGRDTSRKIRQFEEGVEGTLPTPIIAMTADVMPGTEEKCLKAGMNDYISKPIDEKILKRKLSRWFDMSDRRAQVDLSESQKKKDSTQEALKQETPRQEECMDLSLLNEYTDNDITAQKNLIDIFYKKSLQDLNILKDNCVDGHNKEWSDAAHSLKGSTSYIGAENLKNMCAKSQSMIEGTKIDRVEIYTEMRKEHDRVCKALEKEGLLKAA